ncbi:Acyl carrier protein [Fulvivirga imtechensis AK7]|uniref:Acyl carrier protein n=1 Tax=Fulvivirga imtechensis AK7 TaxID=1237149 RepID=L8JLC1_9BACT|nr:acyl carrier protein [Fulvivirga imtechensis]ELR68269.1 Acyl carrier protein [Fulvivirga imtechensis AK7]
MSKEHVFETVKNVVMEILPDVEAEQITMDKSLRDLGANSIDRMEVVTMSMEELGLKIPLMSFANVSNIEGLVDVLAENYAAVSEGNTM